MSVNKNKMASRNLEGNNPSTPVIPPITNPLSPPSHFNYITHGIDKLVLTPFIDWHNITALKKQISAIKDSLEPNKSLPFCHTSVGDVYIHANRMSHYRHHLKITFADIYFNLSPYIDITPNAFIPFGSFSLWRDGIDKCMTKLDQLIKELGGNIDRHLVNRADLCVDYHIPDGLSLDLLRSHRVSLARINSHVMDGDRLGTFYCGSRNSGILLRVYNKSEQLRSSHQSYYSSDIDEDQTDCIWRIEFEIRRKSLRQFNIHTLDDLKNNAGSLWQYLTTKWFSLRVPGYAHPEDRSILPLWEDIQDRAKEFGDPVALARTRHKTSTISDPEWYLSHIAGCLPAFAVLSNCMDLPATLNQLSWHLTKWWGSRDFEEACQSKAIDLGIPYQEKSKNSKT